MRVLFVTVDSNTYGANTALINLIVELKRRKIDCEVLLPRHGGFEDVLKKNEVRFFVFKFAPWLTYNSQKAIKDEARKAFNLISYRYIACKLKKRQYTIIHTNSSVTNLGWYLSRKWHIPHVWHVREKASFHDLKYIYKMNFVKKCYDSADIVLTISEYIAEEQKKLVGNNNLTVVYDGIPMAKNEPINVSYKGEYYNICVVGAISKNKNQLTVCKAINNLVTDGIDNVKCYIVGAYSDKAYYTEITRYIQSNGLEKNIFLVGHSKNPSEYYDKCHMGIMASEGEGFGLVTVEYMLHSLCVLAYKSGATPEIIKDGITGILYESNESDELAKRIKWCINNPSKIQTMTSNAYRDVINRFDIKLHAERIVNIYSDLSR